jgi:hypothetical protein
MRMSLLMATNKAKAKMMMKAKKTRKARKKGAKVNKAIMTMARKKREDRQRLHTKAMKSSYRSSHLIL